MPYFRETLAEETSRLSKLCKSWQEIANSSEIPEDAQGDIRTAIGLTELLMDQRFTQFSGLVDDCEFHRGEKETTSEDLQGFWDMVYVEVEKVNKTFSDLEELKANDWVAKPELKVPAIHKKKPLVTKPPSQHSNATSNAKAYILAARKRLAEAKALKANSLVHDGLSKAIEEIKENISTEKSDQSPKSLKLKYTSVQSKKNSPVKMQNGSSSPKLLQKSRVKSGGNKEKSSEVVKRQPAVNKVAKDFIPLQCVTRAAAKRALMSRNQSI